MTKYCNDSSYGYNGFTDTLTELEPEDDAAYVNWSANWRMPSLDQIAELRDNRYTVIVYTTQNGVDGQLITSRSNGNSIFLPHIPYGNILLKNAEEYAPNAYGDVVLVGVILDAYWSRTLHALEPWRAYFYAFPQYFEADQYSSRSGRSSGLAVRPVRNL